MVAEFTDLAEQAHGSVLLRYGETTVLATAVAGEKERHDIDYFPLSVEYEERFYAAGAILGSRFQRREGRPSTDAILSGRIVDRTIRPLFPSHLRNEVQVIITVLSLGAEDPSTVAVNAASLALATSDIPWGGPVAGVRVGKSAEGGVIINPTYAERETSALDVLACGKDGTLNMIEMAAREALETSVAECLMRAEEEHRALIAWQQKIVAAVGKEKRPANAPEVPQEILALYRAEIEPKLRDAVFSGAPGKKSIYALKKMWLALLEGNELHAPFIKIADRLFEDAVDAELHRGALEEGRRPDGRAMDEVRPLFAQAGGVSPALHGSGIFYRGGTHVFTALTLGGPGDSLIVDGMEPGEEKQRFIHHYNFPPFSAGETGRVGGLNRRMVGHGALAEKALEPVLPAIETFPYTIRLVSECFASNGSTSMGATCAATLALMDGGVPITAPVGGIAMGLMMETSAKGKAPRYQVLTDIQGPEDSHGDMDFKVAGTRKGVTAIQMDIKLDGVPVSILVEALEGARKARLAVIDRIEAAIAAPRQSVSPRAPEILTTKVKPDQIGLIIGSGGKTINGIRDESGVDDITIEEDGTVFITGKNGSAARAKEMVEALVKEYKPGEVYDGEVTRLMDFGAFVKIGPNGEGLVHVSEIAPFRVAKVSDALTPGERVKVVVKEIDEKGRINLSIKEVDPDFAARKGLTPSPQGQSASRPPRR